MFHFSVLGFWLAHLKNQPIYVSLGFSNILPKLGIELILVHISQIKEGNLLECGSTLTNHILSL